MNATRPSGEQNEARRHHETVDPHHRAVWIADVILGGQDGLVNVLGVVLGVVAATHDARIVLAAGLAAAVAESVSMAAVAYTSSVATGDLYRSERAREYRHIAAVPGIERAEIRSIYERMGLTGDLLERVVDAITSNRDAWVAVMMAEEHHLAPIERRKSLRSALVVGLSSMIGSLIPIAPFFVFATRGAVIASVAVTAITLFAFGIFKAQRTIGRPVRSGLELAFIGIASSLLGYGVGALFHVQTCP